jgi:uncharacterized protein (UPF0333 family)
MIYRKTFYFFHNYKDKIKINSGIKISLFFQIFILDMILFFSNSVIYFVIVCLETQTCFVNSVTVKNGKENKIFVIL